MLDSQPLPPPRREPYRRAELQRTLSPKSIAVYGASARGGSFGEQTLINCANFKGEVYPVNPKYQEIVGRKCYPSLDALPQSPDLVVIVAGREAVEGMVQDAAAVGAGGVLIFASGYAETGKPERAAQQATLTRIALASRMPIIGPNCIGAFNLTIGMGATFSMTSPPSYEGPERAIGIVSQSGALGVSLLQASNTGVTFSHALTAGNSCDVDVADLIAYLAEDPGCRAIACLFEGMADPNRLIKAAEIAWANNKPLVLYKIATGEEGAKAAVSHTGSLAGSNAAYEAACRRAGIIMVDDFQALIETAAFFAKIGPMKSEGTIVLSTSGGGGIIAADKAEKYGVPMPQPSEEASAVLKTHIPEFGSARNPCDVTAQVISNPGSLTACCEALLSSPDYGVLVTPHVQTSAANVSRLQMLGDFGKKYDKPVCIVWLSQWHEGPGAIEVRRHSHMAVFDTADRCFAVLAAWHWRENKRKAGADDRTRISAHDATAKAKALMAQAPTPVLTERESKEVLASYGVSVTREMLVKTADDAVRTADELGYPVVMKIESPDIPHKTEAGVIRLNLKTSADVRTAYDAVTANAARVDPPPKINGVLVQQMVPPGLEMVIGARNDPLFGPLILVGLGGVLVELVKDTAIGLAPVSKREALAMLASLKGQKALDGFRGSTPVDRDKLAETIARISEFAADQKDQLAELDANPIICSGDRMIAVDALVVKKAG